MASEEPRPFGAYVLLKALGRGAMGDVHLARPYNPNRGVPTPVVVKRLHGELANKKGFVSRFKHEASIAVSVDSLHVAKVYDVGSIGDTLYIVMEYVGGWPLSKVLDAILKSGRHASIASVVDSIAGGLEGLHALHTAVDAESGKPLGIVHRDISPKNLMIGEDGQMHIIDLGLGKSNAQDWKTRTGVVMGSVGYMPPEQVNGEHVDARADVYAMGVVSFEMLALRNYIKRGPLTQMMAASVNPKWTNPSEFRPDVPRGLDAVIEKACKLDKEERFQSSAEFLRALRNIVPASHTAGGMRELVKELFGETKAEREREMEMLLNLPLPVEDPMEHEPTKVFVQRAGVRPAQPGDRAEATRQVAMFADAPSVPPTVATEVAWKDGSGSYAARMPPADTLSDELIVETHAETPREPLPSHSARFVSPMHAKAHPPMNGTSHGADPAAYSQQLVAPRSSGVPMGVLLVSVVVAAVVGAVVAVLVSQQLTSGGPVVMTSVPARTEAVEVTPSAVPAERVAAVEEPPPPIEPVEVPVEPPAAATSKRRAPKQPAGGGGRGEAPAANDAPPKPPTPEQARARVDAELQELLSRAETLIATLPPGPSKTRVIQIKLDLRRDQNVPDLDRVRDIIKRARAELHELSKTE